MPASERRVSLAAAVDLLQALEEKVSLYLAAGAREAWVVFRDLTITIYDAQGNRSESALGIAVQEVARRASALLA